ncbi:MAG: hypothetical protein ABJC19_06330 [Gemmatimonadota bacterium]
MGGPTLFLVQDPRGAFHGVAGDSARAIGDTLGAAVGTIRDTVTAPPLPGGVAAVVRFIFGVPQAVQIAGLVVATILALIATVFVFRRRAQVVIWLRTRNRAIQLTLAGSVIVVLALTTFGGVKSWNYMQHDNGFCTGCHIMEKPFGRFQTGAGKHNDLKCHDCHQQSIFASSRQLVLWVANRPLEIPKHAPVPNSRCESCHQQEGPTTKGWEHVHQLAGHRVHFDSDSLPLKDLKCVTCHGAEVHRFIPSSRTCQQAGCHVNHGITLGKMAALPEVNCALCHSFRADLSPLATDSAARLALIPARAQCTTCHQMEAKLPGYKPARDPHKGTCGSCHDVHADRTPQDARTSCVKCHVNLEKSPFHTGPNHQRVQAQCLTCHDPHAASVDASDCVGCHTTVRRHGQFKPPLPFDTNSVLRRRVSLIGIPVAPPLEEPPFRRGKGDLPPDEDPPPSAAPTPRVALLHAVPADSFPHSRHTSLACLTCHNVSGRGGKLVFEAPRGCDLCHHQQVMRGQVEPSECARCHAPEKLEVARIVVMTVAVSRHAPRPRDVTFAHATHRTLRCADCHAPPDVVPPDSVRSCQGCHIPHHAEGRDCATCHGAATAEPAVRALHTRETHGDCDQCHTRAIVSELVPVRAFCLTCHSPQRSHRPDGECSTCHFLASPTQYRSHLITSGAGA